MLNMRGLVFFVPCSWVLAFSLHLLGSSLGTWFGLRFSDTICAYKCTFDSKCAISAFGWRFCFTNDNVDVSLFMCLFGKPLEEGKPKHSVLYLLSAKVLPLQIVSHRGNYTSAFGWSFLLAAAPQPLILGSEFRTPLGDGSAPFMQVSIWSLEF